MNIGFFTDTYQPTYSGVETSIDLFKNELEKQGHKVYIFAPLHKNRFNTPEENKKGIYRLQAVSQDFVPEFKLPFPISASVFKHFGRFNLDLIHSQTPFFMGFYANFVGTVLNLPVIHTYHTFYEKYSGHTILRNKAKADELLMQFTKKVTLLHSGRCDKIIAPSLKMKKVLQSYGLKNPIVVIPTGINLKPFAKLNTEKFRAEYSLKKTAPLLLFTGRIAKEKNISFLLKVLKEILKDEKETRLVIVGEGPAEKLLRAEAKKLQIERNVIFTGHRQNGGLLEVYGAADIFAFASLTDTQSLVLMEAAAAGLPIVMQKDEGLTEIVENGINGYEIAGKEQEFAAKAVKIIRDKNLRRQMGEASKELVAQYSIEKQTVKLVALYHETLTEHLKFSLRSRFKRKLNQEVNLKQFFSFKRNKEFLMKLSQKTKDLFNNFNKF